jgi:hypothetical protein
MPWGTPRWGRPAGKWGWNGDKYGMVTTDEGGGT